MSLGTGQEALIRGNSNSPFISLQPSVALADKAYGETGVFLGVAGGSTPLLSAVGSGGHIKFNGTAVDITATTVHMSGSSITLETPKFYMGESSQYISGSNGNIEISSSMFHLDPANDKVSISGSIIATDGSIGGWSMSSYILQSIDSNGGIKFDSYNKQIGIRSGSAVETTIVEFGRIGGTVGSPQFGLEGKDTSGNVIFKLGEAGNEIAGWTITDTEIKKGTNIGLDSSNKKFTINNTTFGNTGIQLDYNSGTPRFFAGKSTGEFVKFDGSNIEISSSAFFLGSNSQYVSGSNGLLEISSSGFYLDNAGNATMQGTITATTGKIANWIINGNRLEDINDRMRIDASTSPSLTINNHSFGQSGVQIDYNSAKGRFYVGDGANRHLKFDGTGI